MLGFFGEEQSSRGRKTPILGERNVMCMHDQVCIYNIPLRKGMTFCFVGFNGGLGLLVVGHRRVSTRHNDWIELGQHKQLLDL